MKLTSLCLFISFSFSWWIFQLDLLLLKIRHLYSQLPFLRFSCRISYVVLIHVFCFLIFIITLYHCSCAKAWCFPNCTSQQIINLKLNKGIKSYYVGIYKVAPECKSHSRQTKFLHFSLTLFKKYRSNKSRKKDE